ncbi:hypothetical protein [Fontivita pretiosa]|uniref:hypothetical protein n=1 Tax=Fontivita pretiosa TaxID=2989684 RepID=UPI003D17A169
MSSQLRFAWALGALLGICVVAFGENKSGPITLKESEFGPPEGAPRIELGKTVKVTARPYITDFFGAMIVNAGATVSNTGNKPMFFVFNIALFDKDGRLLGCANQTSFGDEGIKPGEETQLGSCFVHLPPEELKKVASFQVTLFESEKKL